MPSINDDDRHYACLVSTSTQPGAAKARYAAAMHFYNSGMLDGDTLEIYRTLAKCDTELPNALLAASGKLSPGGTVMLGGKT